MPLPEPVRKVLPPDTAATWEAIAPAIPAALYLGGGTALAVHLAHRESRDLDFFYHRGTVDLDSLRERLSERGTFAVTEQSPGTLNGLWSGTRLQFLHADEAAPQRRLEPTREVAGINVAGLGDLLAMKLKVIGDRGELRDYFDLMTIETKTGRTVEEGLALFIERYGEPAEPHVLAHIVQALGYLDDVDEDDLLPAGKAEIERYWRRRQPQVLANLSRFGP